MNTPLITEAPEVAREKLRAYRRNLHRRADAEYRAVAQGYAELAAGRALLNLRDCFLACPVDHHGWPRLAIARADRKQVKVARDGLERVVFDTRRNSARNASLRIPVDVPRLERPWAAYALVPMIPAQVLNALPVGTALASTFVLWEVEQWSEREIGARADRDPYLLKHLGGDLYAVLAEWDLTELERAVMAGRARG